ncbi:diacylglycerol kinase (ATP) [Georgenia satyanarayanai]|uniref:Diacylglycerol kinase (ATP) n=1 Tax=Georgenia satyanarayanai TaxID=860221 RepID=A0A2Y9A0U1_9MICO|nr:diacylglycerol kinase family protein [Georgenia satyanarayanai]PYG02292.1 diacylglycerol kinase (ATP) [Georgenia satyanarayanai]SSA37148.1 diacylglycerol kinase (ATP) [Georgenia satyanarayanai]
MRRRVGVVCNPTAGRGRAARARSEVLTGLSEAGHTPLDLTGRDYDDALSRARAALAEGLDAVVVVGGDGMVNLGANVLAGTGVPLGIVAVGSGNDIAGALDLPVHDIPAALAVLRRALTADDGVRQVDAVAVSTPGEPTSRWYVSSLCAGLDAAVGHHASRLRWPGNGGRYVRAIFAELSAFRPYGFRITADGETWEQDATLVTVSNTPLFGGGMRVAPGAVPDDGLLDLVTARGLSRAAVVRLFPLLFSGRHVDHPAVSVRRARSVRVEPFTALGANPPVAIVDGEPLTALPLQCDVHPRALSVLTHTVEG